MNEQEAYEAWFRGEQGKPYDGAYTFAEAAWHAALAWLRSQGEPAEIPGDVQSALTRMCTPLHESRLSGATAEADARSMRVIREYIERTAAPQPAIPDGWHGVRWDMFPAWLIDHHEGDILTEELLQRALSRMLAAVPEPSK